MSFSFKASMTRLHRQCVALLNYFQGAAQAETGATAVGGAKTLQAQDSD